MNRVLETPYFLIDKNELDSSLKKMQGAAKDYFLGGYIIGYSYKTNSLPWVIKYFKDQGCYAEVVSNDEYSLAKHIGVESNKFIYNGLIKSKETFLEALNNGCIVNIDSQREIEWLKELDLTKEYNLGIRVNFDIEKECPGESQCGEEGGRFGFCYENGELETAINRIHSIGLKVVGLHLHCSSKTRGLNIYKAIAKYACLVTKQFNLDLKFIDIGGGFFGGLSDKPQFNDYFKLIADILSDTFDLAKTKIVIEPGMALIGSCISYVASVIDIKNTNRNRFVVIDGSRTNVDPLMTKTNYFYELITASETNYPKQVISGFTCMEHDRLMALINKKELSIGDRVVFNKVGAYTMCLSPLFIKYFPRVFVKDGNDISLIREQWTANDYCSGGNV